VAVVALDRGHQCGHFEWSQGGSWSSGVGALTVFAVAVAVESGSGSDMNTHSGMEGGSGTVAVG
jgi:hypothetical protein